MIIWLIIMIIYWVAAKMWKVTSHLTGGQKSELVCLDGDTVRPNVLLLSCGLWGVCAVNPVLVLALILCLCAVRGPSCVLAQGPVMSLCVCVCVCVAVHHLWCWNVCVWVIAVRSIHAMWSSMYVSFSSVARPLLSWWCNVGFLIWLVSSSYCLPSAFLIRFRPAAGQGGLWLRVLRFKDYLVQKSITWLSVL